MSARTVKDATTARSLAEAGVAWHRASAAAAISRDFFMDQVSLA
jgi:hypothetical protein